MDDFCELLAEMRQFLNERQRHPEVTVSQEFYDKNLEVREWLTKYDIDVSTNVDGSWELQ